VAEEDPCWLANEGDDESETARKELIELLLTPGAIATSVQPIVDYHTTPPTHWGVECLTHGPRGSVLPMPRCCFARRAWPGWRPKSTGCASRWRCTRCVASPSRRAFS
jgi:hypothetical protein